MEIKCNLAYMRKEVRRMSQAELSEATGKSIRQGRISEIESGAVNLGNIQLETAFRLAKALHCSIDDLFECVDTESEVSPAREVNETDNMLSPYIPDKDKWLKTYAEWTQLVMDSVESAVALGSIIERCMDNIDLVPYEELLSLNFSYMPLMNEEEQKKFAFYLRSRYKGIPKT